MTQTKTITPARQAMLDLINSKKQARTSSSDNDTQKKKKKKKHQIDKPNQLNAKKELDQKRRTAYIVRLGGKMI